MNSENSKNILIWELLQINILKKIIKKHYHEKSFVYKVCLGERCFLTESISVFVPYKQPKFKKFKFCVFIFLIEMKSFYMNKNKFRIWFVEHDLIYSLDVSVIRWRDL